MNFKAGDVVAVDFPGVNGIKRRPTIVLSSTTYHTNRPDVIVGLLTSKTGSLGVTDHILQDWQEAKLKVSSVFRCFIATLPASANFVYVGRLSERDWQGVCACVKLSFDRSAMEN
ncbi:MAG: type II toxin-antitoxin system PemK/MazF family toxin [Cyanobacteria bacterium]|nr:type II toxin-antitoxin system PemK/MazF family toxin [Cyanobacteriota bacterium]